MQTGLIAFDVIAKINGINIDLRSVVREYSLTTDLKSIFIPLILAITSNAINPVCIIVTSFDKLH